MGTCSVKHAQLTVIVLCELALTVQAVDQRHELHASLGRSPLSAAKTKGTRRLADSLGNTSCS